MIRFGLLLFSAYTLGHSHFESVRPEVANRPLAMFHSEVNAAFDQISDRLESLGVMHPQFMMRYYNRINIALANI